MHSLVFCALHTVLCCVACGLEGNLNNSLLTETLQQEAAPPCISISRGTVSCSVRRRPCWWWRWPRPSCRLRSPARPARWLPCTASCRPRHAFTLLVVNRTGQSKRNGSHLNWGELRSTLRSRICFPVELTISSSTAFFSSSSPRPSRADVGSARGSASW